METKDKNKQYIFTRSDGMTTIKGSIVKSTANWFVVKSEDETQHVNKRFITNFKEVV